MNGSSFEIQGLAAIDREISTHPFSPAEYAIVRRVIGATGDLDYQSLVSFSNHALRSGAAALASRQPIITDLPIVQLAVQPLLQATFLNPLQCASQNLNALETVNNTHQITTRLLQLAKAYPKSIFVIGQAIAALTALIELIEGGEIYPALVIATPAGLVDADVVKDRLQDSRVPTVCIRGRKGGLTAAFTIFNELTRLAWVAHHGHTHPPACP